ncbi:MAG: Asp-tRNA(Asn)/Glu-tRNA(Gln) amidotransferase subunit GatA [Phycisphaerae bacterium]|nr:Asp-tRNA(Asn)/Glu-tRNA(Gln) amidotransferase subunit GatA [Phycisphaerae bacterium]
MSCPDRIRFADDVRTGKASATAHAQATLERVRAANTRLNAYNEVLEESCLAQAAAVDADAGPKRKGLLAGVTVAIKDNIATAVGHTTCSSRMLKNYRSPYEATVVTKLAEAGAVVVGKTNLDEFAMGSSTENSAFGPSKNPWDTSRVPGGSSGGSAVAVAAGLCDVALGSDTGGSIRQPASLCGIVGLKPTYGRVSRYGLVAFGSSLDQIGPLTQTVRDSAAVLQVIAGHDPRDSTSADIPVDDYLGELDVPVRGLRVGIPAEYLSDANDPRVNTAVREAAEVYRKLGATIVEGIHLPLTDIGISTYYVIAPAEASSNLARFDGIRYGHRAELAAGEDLFDLYAKSRAEGFGPEVQRRIMIGTYVLSSGYYDAYYKRALQVRRLIKDEFDRAFERCDILLGPTAPTPAFSMGGKSDPLAMYLCDVYTVNTNIAGIPGISIQGGMAKENGVELPIGLQLQAKPFAESLLLRAARMFETATLWHTMKPSV